MKVLVTGAGGFIGSNLCESLLKNKFNVRAFVRYNSRQNPGWLADIRNKKLEVVFGDITDFDSVLHAVEGCDYIYNLAASISVPYSFKNPQTFIDTNILGALNIFRAASMSKKKIKKVIQISSSEVYGNDLLKNKKILTEKTITVSESPYAATKIASDNLAISMQKASSIPIVIARPFNTFGPRQSLRAVIPTLITQFLYLKNNKNKIIKIGNLNTRRDFVYVQDTVEGLMSLLKKNCKPGEVYNICTGKSFSIKDIIACLIKISKHKPKIQISKVRLRSADVFDLKGSNKKIYKTNKWQPKYKNLNGFQKALKKTYDWFEKDENFKKYLNIKKYNV